MAKKQIWRTVQDNCIRHVWECSECGAVEYISPDYYTDNGTPMCGHCDDDMQYVRTEISN